MHLRGAEARENVGIVCCLPQPSCFADARLSSYFPVIDLRNRHNIRLQFGTLDRPYIYHPLRSPIVPGYLNAQFKFMLKPTGDYTVHFADRECA